MATPAEGQETRPATTTFTGDTGLWFVPTGEVLPAEAVSASAYRVNFDYNQGFTDVSNWPVTFGFGLGGRAEVFGAWTVVRRIDRDVRPIFVAGQPRAGGVVNEYPFVRQGWSDNQLGDLSLGAKVNLLSEGRRQPVALALRGMVKLPTAKDDDEGVGHRQGGLRGGRDPQQGNQPAGRALRVRRATSSAATRRGSTCPTGCAGASARGSRPREHLRFTAELHGERTATTR